MDFRQFFDSFFRLNEGFESFFEESLTNKDIFFGNVNENPQNLTPRDMMLKVPESMRPFIEQPSANQGENLFRTKSFVKTLNTDNNGMIEEKIVIRNGDGTEKIITKHSTGGRTTQKEIHRKGNQVISEKEVVSDIRDDIGQIGFDRNKNGFNGKNEKNDSSFKFWKWF